jgi:hypothetical protein
VEAGVVLPVLNKDGFGVACVACEPGVPDAAAPPKRLAPVPVEGCVVGVSLVASLFASLLPKLNPKPPPPLPAGLAALVDAGCEKRLVAEEPEVAAGVDPKSEVVGFCEPASAGLDCAPNRVVPGGGPAGVVEFKAKVFEAAGVADARCVLAAHYLLCGYIKSQRSHTGVVPEAESGAA